MSDTDCPCGGGAFADCCGPFLAGEAHAPTAEALMRSRFSAYARGEYGYLSATGPGMTDPAAIARSATGMRWTRLQVLRTEAGGPDDEHGVVEFVAHGRRAGRPERVHEISRFERRRGRWRYVEGEIKAAGRRRTRRK